MKTSRHFHSSVVIDEQFLYVFGGRDSNNESALGCFEMLNLSKPQDEWHWVTIEVINNSSDWGARETAGAIAINS